MKTLEGATCMWRLDLSTIKNLSYSGLVKHLLFTVVNSTTVEYSSVVLHTPDTVKEVPNTGIHVAACSIRCGVGDITGTAWWLQVSTGTVLAPLLTADFAPTCSYSVHVGVQDMAKGRPSGRASI
jgi:hypothetical protein